MHTALRYVSSRLSDFPTGRGRRGAGLALPAVGRRLLTGCLRCGRQCVLLHSAAVQSKSPLRRFLLRIWFLKKFVSDLSIALAHYLHQRHYAAYTCHQRHWFRCDDPRVADSTAEAAFSSNEKSAYVLFVIKTSYMEHDNGGGDGLKLHKRPLAPHWGPQFWAPTCRVRAS